MSGVTLSELLEEVGITHKQLNEKCTNEHLHDIALFLKSWRTLAPQLRLSDSEVEAVERNSHGEEEKRQKFLESWKAKFAFKAKYRVLVQALLRIGSADQAEEVCRLLVSQQPKSHKESAQFSQENNTEESHYHSESDVTHTRPNEQSSNTCQPASEKAPFGCGCGNCTFFSLIERGCPTPIPSASSFPYLDLSGLTHEQQQELRGRLRFESQEIMMQFQNLVSLTMLSIKEQQIPLSDLVSHITALGAFDPVYKQSQMPALHHCFKDLQTADTVSKVFLVLKDYFSFFNYHVIEHIITMLGTEKDKNNLQCYKEKFDQYAKRRIFECMPQFGPTSETDHADVFVKVDSQYENYTVTEVERFRCQLSKLLGISSQGVLRLSRIETGCFQLTFQVPLFVQQEIFPLSREQERALKVEGVIRLTCCEYQFLAENMSGVTLDELLKEVGITHKQLNEKCTNEHLHDIALFLKSWRTLAPQLGLSSSEVEAVEGNAHSEKERRQKFLESWKAKFAFKATYRVLVEALLKIGNADQAEQVCCFLVSQQPNTPTPVATEDRLFEQVQESTFNKSCKELKITSLEDADLRERKTGSMEKLHLKLHESPRKHKEGMEEIELQEMNAQSVSDETEQLQESTLTESCKGPKTTTLEDSLPDSWELVEAPAEPEKLQESSPEIRQSVSQALNVSYREEKPEDPVVSISKQLIKQTVTSSRFYSSEGDNNGYLMELKFSCESTKSHRTKVNIYIFIQAGKNDSQLMWPLRTTVQLLFIDLGGDTYHVAEISGTWEKPGTFCKDELDIAYEELIPDNKGMLKLQVRLLDC